MNNASDDLHTVTGALQMLATCRDRLDDLNMAVKRQQWQQAALIASDYSSLLAGMTGIDTSASVLNEMVQLEIRHRRCMRQLSSQMSVLSENIASLEAGQQSAQRSLEVAAVIYRQ